MKIFVYDRRPNNRFYMMLFISGLLFLIGPRLFAYGFDDALKDGWPLQEISNNECHGEIFTFPINRIISSITNFNNPGYTILGERPYFIKTIVKHYKIDGKTIRYEKEDQDYYYKNRRITYDESDGIINRSEIFFDDNGRTTSILIKSGNSDPTCNIFTYDNEHNYMFSFKNEVLLRALSEEINGNKIIYKLYEGKRLLKQYDILLDDNNNVINIITTTYLTATNSYRTETKVKYNDKKVSSVEYYSFAVNKVLSSISFFYDNNRLQRTVDTIQNTEIIYSDYDRIGNWLKQTVKTNGIISSITERIIDYALNETSNDDR